MKLSLFSADRLGEVVRNELDQLVARINRVFTVSHDPDTGVEFHRDTQTTVGAAGSADALPATPSAYATVKYLDADGLEQTGVIAIYASE
jgi:hypothetical protein